MSDINEFILNKLEKLDEKLDEIKAQNSNTRAAMEIHEKQDQDRHQDVVEMGAQLKDQSKLLSEYNESLKEHIRRTELLEKRQDSTEMILKPIAAEYQEKQIIEKAVSKKKSKLMKILGLIATLVAIGAGVVEIFFGK